MQDQIDLDLSTAQLEMVDHALTVLENFAQNFQTRHKASSDMATARAATEPSDQTLTSNHPGPCHPPHGSCASPLHHDLNLVNTIVPRQLRLQRIMNHLEEGNFFWPGTLPLPVSWKAADSRMPMASASAKT